MDAKELRIGSCIESRHKKQWVYHPIVKAAQIDHVKKQPNSWRPIKLTEPWLLMFGFVPHKGAHGSNHYLQIKKHFRIRASAYYVNGEQLFSIHLPYNYPFPDTCHVHQLQNLYRTLTGKELKLKKII